jgi:hypothetical protein
VIGIQSAAFVGSSLQPILISYDVEILYSLRVSDYKSFLSIFFESNSRLTQIEFLTQIHRLIEVIPLETLSRVFDEWIQRCERVIAAHGEYFEEALRWCALAARIMNTLGDTTLEEGHLVV